MVLKSFEKFPLDLHHKMDRSSDESTAMHFDDLPIEMQLAIFRLLGVRSLAKCRCVCRSWQSLSDQMRPTELVLNALDDLPSESQRWHCTDEPIDSDSLINRFDFKHFRLMSREITLNLSRLKRLKIASFIQDCGPSQRQRFEDFFLLNAFFRLEHLELPRTLFMYPKALRLPNLPNLRILRIGSGRTELSVDSPKLRTFSCPRELSRVKVEHPLSIRELETGEHESEILRKFANVEVFKLCRSWYPDYHRLLDDLPKLREFHLVVWQAGATLYEYDARRLLDSMIAERKRRRSDLRIFFMGHLMEGDRPYDEYNFFLKCPQFLSDRRELY